MKSIFAPTAAAACFTSLVVADAPQAAQVAIDDLNSIATRTDNLTKTIQGWNGTDISYALQISSQSTMLVNYINNLTDQLRGISGTFSDTEAFNIGAPTQDLAYAVNASIAALIKQKDNFQTAGIITVVPMSLSQQKNASDMFSALLVGKVPSDVQPVAQALSGQVTASLQMGLDCFSRNESCSDAVANSTRTRTAAINSGAYKAAAAPRLAIGAAGYAAFVAALFATACVL